MLWKIYSIIISTSTVYNIADTLITDNMSNIAGALLSVFTAIGVIGYAFGKKIGPHLFWHIYTTLAIVMFLLVIALIIFTFSTDLDASITWLDMAIFLINIPAYYALWRYTFKSKVLWA